MILMCCLSLCFELLYGYDGSVWKCFYGSSPFRLKAMRLTEDRDNFFPRRRREYITLLLLF